MGGDAGRRCWGSDSGAKMHCVKKDEKASCQEFSGKTIAL